MYLFQTPLRLKVPASVFAVLASLTLGIGPSVQAAPLQRPILVAHTMPWFQADPATQTWGWHWTMNAFNPENMTGTEREIATHYYPLTGPYDSGDPAVIEYQLLLMKLAGIDGIMVDWYGVSHFADYPMILRNTQLIFNEADKLGLRYAVCYEDQTITHRVDAKNITPDSRIDAALKDINWARQHWFTQPNYLRLKGAPVLFSFGSNGLTDDEWAHVLPNTAPAVCYFSEIRRRSVASGTFDWPLPQIGLSAAFDYDRTAKKDGLFVPVVFPRFHDIYKQAKVSDGYPEIPDNKGQTFQTTLTQAWLSGAPLVQIATWNDWGEGTQIEPSREFGTRDLEAIQNLRRKSDKKFTSLSSDLTIPSRILQLRNKYPHNATLQKKLDKVVNFIVSGKLTNARAALNEIAEP